jgi:hypothetical protein
MQEKEGIVFLRFKFWCRVNLMKSIHPGEGGVGQSLRLTVHNLGRINFL